MFSNANHLLALREERRDGQKTQDGINDDKLKGLVRYLDVTNLHPILHEKSYLPGLVDTTTFL